MSDVSNDFNPYDSPVEIEVIESPHLLPGKKTPICIIAIVLGGFGLLAPQLSADGL